MTGKTVTSLLSAPTHFCKHIYYIIPNNNNNVTVNTPVVRVILTAASVLSGAKVALPDETLVK